MGEVNDCLDCTAAAIGPCGMYTSTCRQCTARGVSRGRNFRASRIAGVRQRAYREELELAGVTHEEVLAARSMDFEASAQRNKVPA